MATTNTSAPVPVSCVACSACGNYEPIESQQCSRCGTSFVVTPPFANSQPDHENNSATFTDHAHQNKMHGLLLITSCNVITLALLIGTYFSEWFIRTPLADLSINYYLDHASYNTDLAGYDAFFPYSQCTEYNGEYCDDLKEYERVSTPLWIASCGILLLLTVLTSVTIVPYYIYKCGTNRFLLSLSKPNKSITVNLVCVLFSYCVVFTVNSSALIPFLNTFPYTIFCFYEEYDDENIGCQWGSAVSLGVAANALLLHSVLFTLCLLLVYRTPSTQPAAATPVTAPNVTLLSEGMVNYNQPPQPENNRNNRCWKLLLIFACTLSVAAAYLILVTTQILPKSDEGAMDSIVDRWNTAKCFQPSNSSIDYYTIPQGFGLSSEDVCSFTNPDVTNYEYLPDWYSCCPADPTCENAYNYTSLLPDANTACSHALAVITKASCHPLAAEFTPKSNNIYKQSSSEKQDGVFVCALYCKQTWNYCKSEEWNSEGVVSEVFSDEMDFCYHGLQVQVRNEVFTDQCLDAAESHLCLSVIVCFVFVIVSFM